MWFFVVLAGALVLAGLVELLFLPATLAWVRRRWARSFEPGAAPESGGPTSGMVVFQALSWLFFGVVVLVVLLGSQAGLFVAIDDAQERRAAGVLFGSVFLVMATIALVRGPAQLAEDMDTQSRAMTGRPPRSRQNRIALLVGPAVMLVVGAVVLVGFGVLGL